VPILTGGIGYNAVYNFYKNDFVGKMPADTKVVRLSRTVSRDQVVDELILSFTHDREIKVMLPGIQPTGKYVELPHVVVMKFDGNKIAHEHIYWDQASLLAQIGLLDTKTLPVTGIEQSRKLLEISHKNNNNTSSTIIQRRGKEEIRTAKCQKKNAKLIFDRKKVAEEISFMQTDKNKNKRFLFIISR
jgi:carboxymethylenebutenolidase